jgi:hypothetical protein
MQWSTQRKYYERKNVRAVLDSEEQERLKQFRDSDFRNSSSKHTYRDQMGGVGRHFLPD